MLKKIRKDREMSQGTLAKQSGVSLRTIQHYEQGTRDINGASLATLCRMSIALRCRISEILSDQELIALTKKTEL